MKKLNAFQKIVRAKTKKVFPDGSMALETVRWGHEITTPPAIVDSEENGCDIIHDPASVFLMIDHVLPAKDRATAEQGKMTPIYAKKHGITFLDVGQGGVCHAVIPQYGLVMPGDVGVMGDSQATHTHVLTERSAHSPLVSEQQNSETP